MFIKIILLKKHVSFDLVGNYVEFGVFQPHQLAACKRSWGNTNNISVSKRKQQTIPIEISLEDANIPDSTWLEIRNKIENSITDLHDKQVDFVIHITPTSEHKY